MSVSKNTRNKKHTSNSSFKITLGLSGIIYTIILLMVVVIWAFILGIVVGRGYEPFNLLSLLHSSPKKQSPRKKQTNSSSVLTPQELTFYQGVRAIGKGENNRKGGKAHTTSLKKSSYMSTNYLIQVCAFLKRKDAQRVREDLKKKGLSANIRAIRVKEKVWHRVYIEETGGEARLQEILSRLKKMGFHPLVRKP